MIWYFDLLVMGVLTILSLIGYLVAVPKPEKTEATTKDGYRVTVQQMVNMEEKRALAKGELQDKISGIANDSNAVEAMTILFFMGLALIYGVLGNTVDHFSVIPNEVFGALYIIGFYTCLWLFDKAVMKEGVAFIGELTIEAPDEQKQYGAYPKNPFDLHFTLQEMKKQEEQWGISKTKRDNLALELKEYPSVGRSEWLEKMEKELATYSKRMTVHAGLLANSLMTDNPSDEIREILEANRKPDTAPLKVMPPHYIEVMKEIALNTALPDDVRSQAQEVVDSYSNKEVERKNEQMVAEALLEIETVKKFMA